MSCSTPHTLVPTPVPPSGSGPPSRPVSLRTVDQLFHSFMGRHGHRRIDGHSVLSPTPEVFFTTSGMHQLVPHLRGTVHDEGPRLSSTQRCLRTVDLDEVGDDTHLTVFEMLGSWSLGDYEKRESISWSMRFLVDELDIDPSRLYVTVFEGDEHVGPDEESERHWVHEFEQRGSTPHITRCGVSSNWWSMGPTGPCGPDTEVYVYTGSQGDPVFEDSPEFVEVWNNVFMHYDRLDEHTVVPLPQRNVDTGMGLERLSMVLNGVSSIWEIPELVSQSLGVVSLTSCSPQDSRIVVDHLRSSLLLISSGVRPSSSGRGYVLRRLLRRLLRISGCDGTVVRGIVELVCDVSHWDELHDREDRSSLVSVVLDESSRFGKLLQRSSRLVDKLGPVVSRVDIDFLYDTYGIPSEVSTLDVIRSGRVLEEQRDDQPRRDSDGSVPS